MKLSKKKSDKSKTCLSNFQANKEDSQNENKLIKDLSPTKPKKSNKADTPSNLL